MKIKSSMRYNFSTVKMVTIKQTKNSKHGPDSERSILLYTLDENVIWYCPYGRLYADSSKTENKTIIVCSNAIISTSTG